MAQEKTEGKHGNEKRLRLVGTEYKSEESQSPDQTKSDAGRIYKESTEAISSMTKDMQEATRIASTMKTELEEKRSKIAELLATGNPFSDPFKIQSSSPPLRKQRSDAEQDKTKNDQDPSDENYETISAKLDTIIKQNKEIIALLNSKPAPDTTIL